MANGVLGLLKDIHSDKQSEIEKDYYNKCGEIEKRLAKENPKFQELTSKIKARNEQIKKLRDGILETNEMIHIRIHHNPEVIEIRLETSSGNYYYYPLNPGYTEPTRYEHKERYYIFNPEKSSLGKKK